MSNQDNKPDNKENTSPVPRHGDGILQQVETVTYQALKTVAGLSSEASKLSTTAIS